MASSSKTLLTITPYSKSGGFELSLQSARKVSAMINPGELSVDYQVSLEEFQPLGGSEYGKKFNGIKPANISFDLVFDGTGAVPLYSMNAPLEVVDQIQALMSVVYAYDGSKHEPNIVEIVWGNLRFDARLEKLVTKYTLFRPNGRPLRAIVSLSFSSYKTIKESKAEANQQSPDMSHIVVVMAGDTLPLLCQRIYGDCRYYAQVARFNKLVQFRTLTPGMRLHFPPLE